MPERRSVSIIGAGDMGHGFAAHFTVHGQDVTLIDHRQSNLDWAENQIREAVALLRDEDFTDMAPDDVVDQITFTVDQDAGVADADLVLETVPEEVAVKQEVFDAVATATGADTILASNTSGIPITEIGEGRAYADRLVGCHWWFPPYLLTPVEVVRGDQTSEATVTAITDFLDDVDRDPILVEKDAPGFVWNRVQNAVVRECLHIAEEGIASMDDINRAIRDGYATRTAVIGPLETIDIAGLELFQTVADELLPHLCNDTEPSPLFDEYLDRGRGGIADGAGFFEYDESPSEITRRRDERVAAVRRALDNRHSDE